MGRKIKKTAFVLSGGGSRGAYQVGVWRALVELGDMVVGVSVGSLNGSMVAQDEQILAENLWRDLETDHIFDVANDAQITDFAMEFLKQGGAGTHGLKKFVDNYIDDEKVRESKTDFGLLVVEVQGMKPHYLWKEDIPKGKIGDYIMASSSAYPAIQAYEIAGKKYIDGGFENVMPIHMAVERGATDIVAVYLRAAGKFDRDAEIQSAKDVNLTLIEPKWDLGNFLLFDKANTARIMRLGYQDAMKAFGVYDGELFSFIKGTFDKRKQKSAEAAGKIFEVDPLTLYNEKMFLEKLGEAVNGVGFEFSDWVRMGKRIINRDENGPINMKSLMEALKSAFSGDASKIINGDIIHRNNRKIAAILIANDLKTHGADSIFLSRHAIKFAKEEVLAGRFIQDKGLL